MSLFDFTDLLSERKNIKIYSIPYSIYSVSTVSIKLTMGYYQLMFDNRDNLKISVENMNSIIESISHNTSTVNYYYTNDKCYYYNYKYDFLNSFIIYYEKNTVYISDRKETYGWKVSADEIYEAYQAEIKKIGKNIESIQSVKIDYNKEQVILLGNKTKIKLNESVVEQIMTAIKYLGEITIHTEYYSRDLCIILKDSLLTFNAIGLNCTISTLGLFDIFKNNLEIIRDDYEKKQYNSLYSSHKLCVEHDIKGCFLIIDDGIKISLKKSTYHKLEAIIKSSLEGVIAGIDVKCTCTYNNDNNIEMACNITQRYVYITIYGIAENYFLLNTRDFIK